MFTAAQREEVRQAFKGAGYRGHITTARVTSEDERVFLLALGDLDGLVDVRALEGELRRILGRKVWVVEHTAPWGDPVPFQ